MFAIGSSVDRKQAVCAHQPNRISFIRFVASANSPILLVSFRTTSAIFQTRLSNPEDFGITGAGTKTCTKYT